VVPFVVVCLAEMIKELKADGSSRRKWGLWSCVTSEKTRCSSYRAGVPTIVVMLFNRVQRCTGDGILPLNI